MKENLSSTYTVIPKRHKQPSNQDKEKYNVLNKININEDKDYPILSKKNKQYNSAININNVKINHNRNIDNNIDNSLSVSNNSNKDLINSTSMNNIDDLDENINIKFPCKYKCSINSTMNTQASIKSSLNKTYNPNIREKIIKKSLKSNDNSDSNYNDKYFNTFSLMNKVNQFFQNMNKKEKTLNDNNKNEDTNIYDSMGKNLIYKNYKNTEINNLESIINNNSNLQRQNNFYVNTNINIFKNHHFNKNLNEIRENRHINRKNSIYHSIGPSSLLMKFNEKESKDKRNDSANYNKQFFLVSKKDFQHQFKKNKNYIQKIMDNLPQNKNIKNKYNYDYRKHYNNENHTKLSNIDNNVDYYYGFNSFNNKKAYNIFLKKELSENTINNSNICLDNDALNNSIKTKKVSKYLSVGKQRPYKDMKYINLKNNNNQNNNFIGKNHQKNNGGIYEFKAKDKKNLLVNSALSSIANNNRINLIYIVSDKKYKCLILEFLDKKSIANLSNVCSKFYQIYFYDYFFKKLIEDKNNQDYIGKILKNTFNFCSEKIKSKIKSRELKPFYNSLLKRNDIYDDLILRDLTRTIPADSTFGKDNINYKKLYNILTCYSNYNKKVGYAQGINFICAHAIYLFKSEEEVFIFLDGFINSMKLDNYIGIENESKILHKLNEFSRILRRYVPGIIDYFDNKGVSHDFFTTGWILTLFSSSMERDYLVIVWCFMIIFKWKFVYSFIIQILKKYEKTIFNSSENKLGYKMKTIFKNKDFKRDFNDIIKSTLDFMKNNIIL